MVMGQDKVRKEVLAKSSGGVELLLAVLESTADPTVIQNLVFIINELIQSKSSSSKKVTTLINRGATQVSGHSESSLHHQRAHSVQILEQQKSHHAH